METCEELPPMSNKSRQRLRARAYKDQSSRCFYCKVQMWVDDSTAFADRIGANPKAAKLLQCTAEHLLARCDGGADSVENVVAACVTCNARRHKRKFPLNPDQFGKLVQTRVRQGRWHPAWVYASGLLSFAE